MSYRGRSAGDGRRDVSSSIHVAAAFPNRRDARRTETVWCAPLLDHVKAPPLVSEETTVDALL